jgi:hypothetical protein
MSADKQPQTDDAPTMHLAEPIVKIINTEWTCNKHIIKLIKDWVDVRLQECMKYYYPIDGFDYKKAVVDIDSIRQLTMLINMMVEYVQKRIPDDCDSIDELGALSNLMKVEYNSPVELMVDVVVNVAESSARVDDEDGLYKILENIIMSDISSNQPHLIDDDVVAAVVASYMCSYIKDVLDQLPILMHTGAKRVRHDIFNQAMRIVYFNSQSKSQKHKQLYNLAHTALYNSLPKTKHVAKK